MARYALTAITGHRAAEQIKGCGIRALASTSQARHGLIEKGLIYSPKLGYVDFTVPHFTQFMRRRYPLEAVLTDDGS
jgi:hypothetical protein